MFTHVNPSFTIQKWGLKGSKLYRHVFVMVFDRCMNARLYFSIITSLNVCNMAPGFETLCALP